uniref:Uncharacterized protein n=1 Tax=Vespula pensylvanica TaxID=30213 RepID=A0A834K117_VESPE|nr:hypothetical protein H0235_016159 [Vespula pensylvanica]
MAKKNASRNLIPYRRCLLEHPSNIRLNSMINWTLIISQRSNQTIETKEENFSRCPYENDRNHSIGSWQSNRCGQTNAKVLAILRPGGACSCWIFGSPENAKNVERVTLDESPPKLEEEEEGEGGGEEEQEEEEEGGGGGEGEGGGRAR